MAVSLFFSELGGCDRQARLCLALGRRKFKDKIECPPFFGLPSCPVSTGPLNASKQAALLSEKRISPETGALFSKAFRMEADNIPS
jgi:hypothetical protein